MILRAASALAAAFGVLLLFLPLIISSETGTNIIEGTLSEGLGRKITIDSLEFSWSGAIGAGGVTVADDPAFSGEPFLTIKKIGARFTWGSLFDGKPAVTLAISGLRANLVRDRTGRSNLDALISGMPSKKEAAGAPETKTPAEPIPEADIKLDFEDIEIRAEDRERGLKTSLVSPSFKAALNSAAPGAVEIAFAADIDPGTGKPQRADIILRVENFIGAGQTPSPGKASLALKAALPGLTAEGAASNGSLKLDLALTPDLLVQAARPFLPDSLADASFTGELKLVCEINGGLTETPLFKTGLMAEGFTFTGGPLGKKNLSLPQASLFAAGTADRKKGSAKVEKGELALPGIKASFNLDLTPKGENGHKISGALTAINIDLKEAAKLAAPFTSALDGLDLKAGPNRFGAGGMTFELSLPEKEGKASLRDADLALPSWKSGPSGRETMLTGLALSVPSFDAVVKDGLFTSMAGTFSMKLSALAAPGQVKATGLTASMKASKDGGKLAIQKLDLSASRVEVPFSGKNSAGDGALMEAFRLEMGGARADIGDKGALNALTFDRAAIFAADGKVRTGGDTLKLGKFSLETSGAGLSFTDGRLSKAALKALLETERLTLTGKNALSAEALSADLQKISYLAGNETGSISADVRLKAKRIESPGKFLLRAPNASTGVEAGTGGGLNVRLAGLTFSSPEMRLDGESGPLAASNTEFSASLITLDSLAGPGNVAFNAEGVDFSSRSIALPFKGERAAADNLTLSSPRFAFNKNGETRTAAGSLKASASKISLPGGTSFTKVSQSLEADINAGQNPLETRGALTLSIDAEGLGKIGFSVAAKGGKGNPYSAKLEIEGDAPNLARLALGQENATVAGGRIKTALSLSGTLGKNFDTEKLRELASQKPLNLNALKTALGFIGRAEIETTLTGLDLAPSKLTGDRPLTLSTLKPLILSASGGFGEIKGEIPLSFILGAANGGKETFAEGETALSFTLEDLNRLTLTHRTKTEGGMKARENIAMSIAGLTPFLENPASFTPEALLGGTDLTLAGNVEINAATQTVMPGGLKFSGKAGTDLKLTLKRAEELALELSLDMGNAEMALQNGTLITVKKARTGIARTYRLKPEEKSGPEYLSQTVFNSSEKKTDSAARSSLNLKLPDREPEIEIPRLMATGPAKPLEISKLRIWLKFEEGLPVFDYFTMETLKGSVGGTLSLIPDGPGFAARGALAFSSLDMAELLPQRTAEQRTGQSEIGGTVAISAPLAEKWSKMAENLRFDARLNKIGPRALDSLLRSLDPTGTNQSIMNQRKLLATANVEWLGAKAVNGSFSLSGGLKVKGISIPMPGVENVPLTRLVNLGAAGEGPPGISSMLSVLDILNSKELKYGTLVKR